MKERYNGSHEVWGGLSVAGSSGGRSKGALGISIFSSNNSYNHDSIRL